jgi:hypothetical protein
MSNSLTLSGTIKLIDPIQSFPSGFQKREFVITTAEQYPQDVKFEVVKDKCATLDKYAVGQSVAVSFNCRGNEFQGKYYVSLQAWKIEAGANVAAPVAPRVADPIRDEPFDDTPF